LPQFVAPKIGYNSWRKNKLSKKMYVGNLSFQTTENEVRDLFEEYGEIESVAMIMDRDSGRFRGFCFVEMDDAAATAAIAALDGKPFGGRDLRVNAARPSEDRGGKRGGGNRGGGNRSGGGNRGGDYGNSNRYPDSGGSNW
jgi:RNA recognition motif-containing protein